MNWLWYLLGLLTWPAMFIIAIFAENIGLNFPSVERNAKFAIYSFFVGQVVVYYSYDMAERCKQVGYKVRSIKGMQFSLKILIWCV